MFEPEVFRKQMYCVEESTCDIVGPFRRPTQSFGAREIVPPLVANSIKITSCDTAFTHARQWKEEGRLWVPKGPDEHQYQKRLEGVEKVWEAFVRGFRKSKRRTCLET